MTQLRWRTAEAGSDSAAANPGAQPTVKIRRKPGPRPGTEAARRGGNTVREKYGVDFYRRIGAKGGSSVRGRRDSTYYAEIGRRGGETTKRNRGIEHYSRIGRIGGAQHSRQVKKTSQNPGA